MLVVTRERESVGRASGGSLPSVSDADSGLTVYEEPTCSTCRSLFTLLIARGIDVERVNYIVDPLSRRR